MTPDELEKFFEDLTAGADDNLLENIIKLKTYIGELNQQVTDITVTLEENENTILARDTLIKKYEAMLRDYSNSIPVAKTINTDAVSDYDDFINEEE